MALSLLSNSSFVQPLANAEAAAVAMSSSLANNPQWKGMTDVGSIKQALMAQLGPDVTGKYFGSMGDVTGQMSATSAAEHLTITSPMIFRFVILAVDQLTKPLFQLFPFKKIAPNERQLKMKQVIYHADIWERGVEYVPGGTQTQTSQEIQSYTEQYVKGISMDLNLFLTPEGYAEYMRQAYQLAVAYALTFVILIVDGLTTAYRIKMANPAPMDSSVALEDQIRMGRDLFAAPVKGTQGLNTLKRIISTRSGASQTPINTLIGPEDINDRLSDASASEMIVSSERISIVRPPSLNGMKVVAIKPIYMPGTALNAGDMCATMCGYMTYSICQCTKGKDNTFLFYDIKGDKNILLTAAELAAEAKKNVDKAGDADACVANPDQFDYLVVRAHFFKTISPFAIAPGSLAIYSSVPTILTSVSTFRMDVNTQARVYLGILPVNPAGILTLSNLFPTHVLRGGMKFLDKDELKDGRSFLQAAWEQKANTMVFAFKTQKTNRSAPEFLPVTLTQWPGQRGVTTAATSVLADEYSLDAAEGDIFGAGILKKMGLVGDNGKGQAIATYDEDQGIYSGTYTMFRDYHGKIVRDRAGDPVKFVEEVNSEAPHGRVVKGMGKILTASAQGDRLVTQTMPSPMSDYLVRA